MAAGLALRVPQATELGRRTLQQLRLANPRPTGGLAPAEMTMAMALFGAGIGWRPELTGFVGRRQGLGFAEVVAEGIHRDQPLPGGLEALMARGWRSSRTGSGCRWGRPTSPTRSGSGLLAGLAERLGAPLVSEHVAALLEWPAPELDEAAFLTELLERTGALLLLDLANTYANARNHGRDRWPSSTPCP